MTQLILTLGPNDAIVRWRYIDGDSYTPTGEEVAVPPDSVADGQLPPPGSMRLASTDPVEVEPNPGYEPPDPLDRSGIDPALLAAYREARDTYLTERQNFIDAKQADDVQGQLDALAALAENATVPALDALFQVAMGEEP